MELLILNAVVGAHERRYLEVCNILGAYLSDNMDGEVRMILEGRLAQLMKMVIPEIYSQHIHMDRKNKKLLCVNLEKALYGCLKSAFLF